jgi:hypothetical protein
MVPVKLNTDIGKFVSSSFDIGNYSVREGEGRGIDLHKLSKNNMAITAKPDMVGGCEGVVLDVNAWLPAAAKVYNTSPDIRDYVMVPTPALITDLPNTNGDSASLTELLQFKPKLGMQAYKTYKGKPTFREHDNQDHTKARGIILDAYLKPLRGFRNNHAKLILLLAYDRTRDPEICNRILSNECNTHSVGFYYTSYTCSYCGHTTHQDTMLTCSHTRLGRKPYLKDGQIVYRWCHDSTGFECSQVENPAYVSNQHDPKNIMMVR